MFASEDICLIFLITSENINYEFSKAIFTELWKFWWEVRTVVLECMYIQNDDKILNTCGAWFSLQINKLIFDL